MCSLHVSRKVRLGSCRTPPSAENITIVRITWPPPPLPATCRHACEARGRSLYKRVICLVSIFVSVFSSVFSLQSSFSLRAVFVWSTVYVFTVFSLRVFVTIRVYVSAGLSFGLPLSLFRWIIVYRRCSSGLAFTQASVLAVITLFFTLPWVVFSGWDRKCDVM